MRVIKIEPDYYCGHCFGTGEVYDIVDYGSTVTYLPSFCHCVEEQLSEENVEDLEYKDFGIEIVMAKEKDQCNSQL